MLFRFAAALLLVVAVSMTGIALEKQSLRLRSSVSRQYYQTDLLLELHARRRLTIQQMSAPSQLAALEAPKSLNAATFLRPQKAIDARSPDAEQARANRVAGSGLPLLRWERPVNPAVIE